MSLFRKKSRPSNIIMNNDFFPLLSGKDIINKIATHLVNEIKNLVNAPAEIFDNIYLNTIIDFAELCQDMPWTQDGKKFDLLTQQLNLCISTLKLRQSRLLPQNTCIENIAEQEPKWTYGFFLSSLLFQIHKLQNDRQILIYNSDEKKEDICPIFIGLKFESNRFYKIKWKNCQNILSKSEFMCFLVTRLISSQTLNWLYQSQNIFEAIWVTLTTSNPDSVFIETINKAVEFINHPLRESTKCSSEITFDNEIQSSNQLPRGKPTRYVVSI